MLFIGTNDARADEIAVGDSLRLVRSSCCSPCGSAWATPLVGEVRARHRDTARKALVRAAAAATFVSLVFLAAVAQGIGWTFWNEANSLYWGTVHETTATTLLPTWPSPVVLASWLSDSTAVQMALVAGMAAWVVGWTCTLFLAATRVLVAAAADGALPRGSRAPPETRCPPSRSRCSSCPRARSRRPTPTPTRSPAGAQLPSWPWG